MKHIGDGTDFLAWAKIPPARGHRFHWEKTIVECVMAGDTRFVPILQTHIDSGAITSESAKQAINGTAEYIEG